MENNIKQEQIKKGMDEQKKERLTKIYNGYQVVDWIIHLIY